MSKSEIYRKRVQKGERPVDDKAYSYVEIEAENLALHTALATTREELAAAEKVISLIYVDKDGVSIGKVSLIQLAMKKYEASK